jgi:drug/metabolite transporter (DMT)-like permease
MTIGDLTVLLPQTSLFFLVVVSMLLLGARYSFWQLWSVLLILCGVFVTLLPTFKGQFDGTDFSSSL